MSTRYWLLLFPFSQALMASEETWTGSKDGLWNNPDNWMSAPSQGMQILFNRPSSQTHVQVEGASYYVGSLTFDAANAYTLSGMEGRLIFNSAPAQIHNLQGSHKIDLPVVLNAEGAIDLATGSTLTFGKESLVFGPKTLRIGGLGDLVNESQQGISPDAVVLEGGTVTNRQHAILGDKVRLFSVAGGTLINGEITDVKGSDAAREASLIEIKSGTVVNEHSYFGIKASHCKMYGGTVVNRREAFFCSSVPLFEMFGGTAINDGSYFGVHRAASRGELIIHKGTIINQNKGVLGSYFTDITLKDGIIINSKDSHVLSSSFQMEGGTIINDGIFSIVENDAFIQMHRGVITGTGSFVAGNVDQKFTFQNADTLIPGTIASTSHSILEMYHGVDIEGRDDFVRNLIEENGYGQLTAPSLQFIPGTLDMGEGGKYEQTPDATLVINVSGPKDYGQIKASTANLNGALQINALSNFDVQPGDVLTIVKSSGGISGAFSSVEGFHLPSLIPMVSYLEDSVEVSFSPTLDSYVGGISQPLFASVNHLNIQLNGQMQRLRERFKADSSARSLPVVYLMADNDERRLVSKPQAEKKTNRPWNFYWGPLGSLGKVASKPSQMGFDYWSAGALAGFDYAFSQVGLGFVCEYERIDAHVHENWGSAKVNHGQGSLYATYTPSSLPPLAVNGIVGGGGEWYQIDRHTGTLSTKKTAKGTPHGYELDTLLGLEYTFWKDAPLHFTPMASLQYIFLHISSYKEKDAGLFNLEMGHQRAQSLRSLLGAKLDYRWGSPAFSFTMQVDGAWQREYLDHNRSVNFSPLSVVGPASSVAVIGAGRNTALTGADLLFTWNRRFDVEVRYDYEWNTLFQDHFFYLGFNSRF